MNKEDSGAQASGNNLRRIGEKELQVALRAVKNTLYARSVFAKFSMLGLVTERLAYQIGDQIMVHEVMPVPGRPPKSLLHQCINNAFRRFDIAIEDPEATPKSVKTAYINGLLSMVYELAFVKVTGPTGEQWDPLLTPFTLWAPKNNPYTVEYTNDVVEKKDKLDSQNPLDIGISLLRRVMSRDDFIDLMVTTDIIQRTLKEAG